MHPDLRQRPAARGQRLRRLVLVVREDQVVAAAVDLERRAERLLGHRRALDVPARPAASPGRVPGGVLHRLLRLPEREVERILLERGALDAPRPGPSARRRGATARRIRQRAHAEVDVALDRVGVPALDQRADQRDDLLHHLRRLRLVVGPAEPEPVGVVDVRGRHLGRQLVGRAPGGTRRVVDLVVDVGDVRDQRRLVALVRQEAGEQAEDDVRARVADVDARVDGRAARVDPDLEPVARAQLLQLTGLGVVQADRAHRGGAHPSPSTEVAWCGHPTGLDSGEPRWRR